MTQAASQAAAFYKEIAMSCIVVTKRTAFAPGFRIASPVSRSNRVRGAIV
jgi:hypothetical protein